MTPKVILQEWLKAFNNADASAISELYADDAVNHQVVNMPIKGKSAIKEMFTKEFQNAEMVCIPENIFQDGEWAILEWKDPKGMRGCGFFQVRAGQIIFQRGYWDRLTFQELHGI